MRKRPVPHRWRAGQAPPERRGGPTEEWGTRDGNKEHKEATGPRLRPEREATDAVDRADELFQWAQMLVQPKLP